MSEAKSAEKHVETPENEALVMALAPLLGEDGQDMELSKHAKITKEPENDANSAQDRGWAWVIAFAAFMTHFVVDGCIASFGIFYSSLLRVFGTRPAVTSLAGSLIVGVYLFSSPLAGFLVRRYSCRLVGFVGGCVAAAGFVLASFSANILLFMLGYGVIAAVGVGMNALPAMIMVNEYFHRKRGIGQGILFSGAGCGVFVLVPVSQVLLSEYGWRGAFLITGGIILHFCVFALLLRPLENIRASPDISDKGDTEGQSLVKTTFETNQTKSCNRIAVLKAGANSETYSSENNLYSTKPKTESETAYVSMPDLTPTSRLPHKKHERSPHYYTHLLQQHRMLLSNGLLCSGHLYDSKSDNNILIEKTDSFIKPSREVNIESDTLDLKSTGKSGSRFCDPSILRHPIYIPILVGGVLLQMAQFIPTTYIPDYCDTIGLSGQQASIVIAVFGAFNVAGRLSAGCLANLPSINSLWMFNLAMLMCGVSCVLFPLCRTFLTLCIYALFLGFFIGFSPPLQCLILVEYLGLPNFSAAMGFLQMAKGPAALAGPPLAGVVYEWTGDYAVSIVFAAALYVLATGIQSMVPIINRCVKNSETVSKQNL